MEWINQKEVLFIKNICKDNDEIVQELQIENCKIFSKDRSSCFSNDEFVNYLSNSKIDELEIVGIDGNCCVKTTALEAVKHNFKVVLDLFCVCVINKERFKKTLEMFKKSNIDIMNESNI